MSNQRSTRPLLHHLAERLGAAAVLDPRGLLDSSQRRVSADATYVHQDLLIGAWHRADAYAVAEEMAEARRQCVDGASLDDNGVDVVRYEASTVSPLRR